MRSKDKLLWMGMLSASLLMMAHTTVKAAAVDWTLSGSIEHMLKVAPEMRAATAQIDVRRGELTRAGAFPNPSIELRADQKLGMDDGSGGTDLTQIAISQPLPFGRLGHQRTMASAQLSAAEKSLLQQRLMLEYHSALVYHDLQLAQARLKLAEQRLAVAESYSRRDKRSKDPIVRYLSKRERLRLNILRETARQELATAEGRYNEALSSFRTSLALSPDSSPSVVELGPVPSPPALPVLQARLEQNPALVADLQRIKAAEAGVDVARSQRLADPVLTVFRERDYLGGSRRDYNGIMLSVQVPLWGGHNGGVSSARAEVIKAKSNYQSLRRDLASRLRLHEMHLGHMIQQASDYYSQLVLPTESSLNLARKSFNAGQIDLLNLIDSYNTHFDAHFRYLELLYQGWMEAADLRLADGLTLREYRQLSAQTANKKVNQ